MNSVIVSRESVASARYQDEHSEDNWIKRFNTARDWEADENWCGIDNFNNREYKSYWDEMRGGK